MIDFFLGMSLAGLAVRGWLRGLVREAMDLVGLVVGVAVAFRVSAPFGEYLASQFGFGPEVARLTASVVIFLVVGLGASVVAHYLQRVVDLPGLNLFNRLLGGGLAVAWGLFLLLLVLSVGRALSLPPLVETALEQSRVVGVVAAPNAPAQRLFQEVAGDEVLDALLALPEQLGSRRVILEEDERLTIEPASADQLLNAPADARAVFDLVNEARVSAGLDPLAWSDGLTEVARLHAEEMYLEGYFSHTSPRTGDVADRVSAAGITFS
ncbi:MAG: CvpA family protein, partial [Acidimicrobiia bacterium]